MSLHEMGIPSVDLNDFVHGNAEEKKREGVQVQKKTRGQER